MKYVSSLDIDKYFLLQAQFDRMKLIDPMLFLFSGDEFVEDLVFVVILDESLPWVDD